MGEEGLRVRLMRHLSTCQELESDDSTRRVARVIDSLKSQDLSQDDIIPNIRSSRLYFTRHVITKTDLNKVT